MPTLPAAGSVAAALGAPHRTERIELQYQGFGVHRDEYTLRDHLDRRGLVRSIGEAIAKDRPPLVYGLHGDWGSGKTSALRAIRFHLSGEDPFKEAVTDIQGGLYAGNVVSVWFEAWRYHSEPNPLVALIQEMRRQLSWWQRSLKEGEKLAAVTAESLLDSIDKAARLIGLETAPLSAKAIRSAGEQWERDRQSATLPTDSIQEFLRQAIAGLLPKQRKGFASPRLVVFIDDLDRCSAESAYRLLEGLKIYLSLENCVFVLGMNQQVVTEAIAERLKKDESDRSVLLRAEAYLEKLCSNIWRLPLPTDPVGYFVNLVDAESARTAISAARGKVSKPHIMACPTSFLPPNPRRLRALANMFNRLRKTADTLSDTYTTDLDLRLLVVAYVYQFHAELFQRWHYDANFLERMRSWLRSGVADEKSEPYFARLSLPTQLKAAPASAATPTPSSSSELDSRFPDPSAPGIFWIAPLLQTTLGNAAPGEFRSLLALPV